MTRREPADDGSSVDLAPSATVAGAELISHISKLRLLAVQKARTYFLTSIASLRKARTNVKQVQVTSLLKYGGEKARLLEKFNGRRDLARR